MGTGCACVAPNYGLCFQPGPSCRGSFSIQVAVLAWSWQQGVGTWPFCFSSLAEVIEVSSFMFRGGYPTLQESCLTLGCPLLPEQDHEQRLKCGWLAWPCVPVICM